MKMSLFVAPLLLLSTASVTAHMPDPRVFFSSQDNIENQLREAIDRTTSVIDGAVFDVSSPNLQQALRRAAARGVSVRLIVDRRENPPGNITEGWEPGFLIRHIAGKRGAHGAMHHKFAIFDGAEVVTGSYNWTPGARYVNHENVLFEDNPAIVAAYEHQFEQLWSSGEQLSRSGTIIASGPRARHHRSRHKSSAHSYNRF